MEYKAFVELSNENILYQKHIFFEAHIPILFLCESSERQLYICDMFDDRDGLNWIVSPTNLSYVDDMIFNKITLSKLFELSLNISVYSWLISNSNKCFKTEQVKFNDINSLDLPSNVYFNADIDEIMDYVRTFNRYYFSKRATKITSEYLNSKIEKYYFSLITKNHNSLIKKQVEKYTA